MPLSQEPSEAQYAVFPGRRAIRASSTKTAGGSPAELPGVIETRCLLVRMLEGPDNEIEWAEDAGCSWPASSSGFVCELPRYSKAGWERRDILQAAASFC